MRVYLFIINGTNYNVTMPDEVATYVDGLFKMIHEKNDALKKAHEDYRVLLTKYSKIQIELSKLSWMMENLRK